MLSLRNTQLVDGCGFSLLAGCGGFPLVVTAQAGSEGRADLCDPKGWAEQRGKRREGGISA